MMPVRREVPNEARRGGSSSGPAARSSSASRTTPARAQRLPAAEKALGKTLDGSEVDGFLAIGSDSSVTIYCGKVDLGQGLRIAVPQMAAEELGFGVERIALVEGDTALTPDQGATAGSTRRHARRRADPPGGRDRPRGADRPRGGARGRPRAELEATGNEVRPKAGGAGLRFGELVGDRRFNLKVDPKAPLKDPATYTVVGKPLPRPDVPAR